MNKDFQTVDEYIQSFPKKAQVHLKAIYFAGYDTLIGLYATPSGPAKFKKELSKYKQGKGSVQFPIDEPMPIELIKQIVEFRLSES